MPSTTRPAAPPIRRLLVGTDFSPGAAVALTRVPFLHLAPRAEITLLHVLPGRPNSAPRGGDLLEAEDRLRRAAAGLHSGLVAAGHPDVRIQTMLAQGEPHAEILRRSARAELVVVGRPGRHSVRDVLVGSTAERVVRHGIVPTLVVGARARSAYHRPIAAVERDSSARATLDITARLLEPRLRLLDVVHAYHPAHEEMLARVGTPAGRTAYRRESRTEAGRAIADLIRTSAAGAAVRRVRLRRADPRQAILGTARARRADLIAVGTHGRTGLAHALLGSVAGAVIRHARCDVLVSPPQRAAKPARHRAA